MKDRLWRAIASRGVGNRIELCDLVMENELNGDRVEEHVGWAAHQFVEHPYISGVSTERRRRHSNVPMYASF